MFSENSQQQDLDPSGLGHTQYMSLLNRLNEVLLKINKLENYLRKEPNLDLKAAYQAYLQL